MVGKVARRLAGEPDAESVPSAQYGALGPQWQCEPPGPRPGKGRTLGGAKHHTQWHTAARAPNFPLEVGMRLRIFGSGPVLRFRVRGDEAPSMSEGHLRISRGAVSRAPQAEVSTKSTKGAHWQLEVPFSARHSEVPGAATAARG